MAKFPTQLIAASLLLNLAAAGSISAATRVSPPPTSYSLLDSTPQKAALPRESAVPRFSPALAPAGRSEEEAAELFLPDYAAVSGAVAAAAPGDATESPLVQEPGTAAGADEDAGEPGWRWRRAGGMEYAVVSVAAVATAYFEHENGRPTEADWTSRNEFDEEIRSALRLKSRGARDATDIAGHAIMGLMIAAPVLDSLATLGVRDGRWDELWQTEMVNLEAFTFTSLVSSVTQNVLARERPFVRDCKDGVCESNLENRGFPSGHVAFAFTGAGLICNHHRYQSLYRDPAADDAACATGIGLAVADGVLRLVADRHYATDVAAGTVLGLFSGFVLPRLLHYSHPTAPVPEKKRTTGAPLIKQVRVLPLVSSSGSGLSCEFRF